MFFLVRIIALLVITGQLRLTAGGIGDALKQNAAVPPTYLEKIKATPYFYQSDPRANFPHSCRTALCVFNNLQLST